MRWGATLGFWGGILSANASRPLHQIRWWLPCNTKSGSLCETNVSCKQAAFGMAQLRGYGLLLENSNRQRWKNMLWNMTICCLFLLPSNRVMWITYFDRKFERMECYTVYLFTWLNNNNKKENKRVWGASLLTFYEKSVVTENRRKYLLFYPVSRLEKRVHYRNMTQI